LREEASWLLLFLLVPYLHENHAATADITSSRSLSREEEIKKKKRKKPLQ
jgi:hypothetical protein